MNIGIPFPFITQFFPTNKVWVRRVKNTFCIPLTMKLPINACLNTIKDYWWTKSIAYKFLYYTVKTALV